MTAVRQLLARARRLLDGRVDDPQLEAQILLGHALGRDRSWLYAWPESVPAPEEAARFEQLLGQRVAGRPVGHLTGRREFWSLDLRVSPDTLIPRPETEQLVEIALALGLPHDARVLDLGTGCGAIALALAVERPHWRITALDRSPAALEVARSNARDLGLGNVQFLCSDWFAALGREVRFDLIVSNPPYVADGDPHLGRGDLRFEPRQALVGGSDGLVDVRRIIGDAPGHLRAGGWLWLEHGFDQATAVAAMLAAAGFGQVTLRRDLAGLERHSGGVSPAARDQGISP